MEFFGPDPSLEDFDNISGSRMRQMACQGLKPPGAFMNHNAWKAPSDYYKKLRDG